MGVGISVRERCRNGYIEAVLTMTLWSRQITEKQFTTQSNNGRIHGERAKDVQAHHFTRLPFSRAIHGSPFSSAILRSMDKKYRFDTVDLNALGRGSPGYEKQFTKRSFSNLKMPSKVWPSLGPPTYVTSNLYGFDVVSILKREIPTSLPSVTCIIFWSSIRYDRLSRPSDVSLPWITHFSAFQCPWRRASAFSLESNSCASALAANVHAKATNRSETRERILTGQMLGRTSDVTGDGGLILNK
ncbi:hypothetical protein RRSWK_03241 [Rhodopirellula sp. SWK7]|nr:hypothetical protein RRSWK_03241 [Rhodopirellula sp. SWK7]